eukprot:822624-Prymnesium_polylepis.1
MPTDARKEAQAAAPQHQRIAAKQCCPCRHSSRGIPYVAARPPRLSGCRTSSESKTAASSR